MNYDLAHLKDILNISKDRVFGFFKEFDEFYKKSLEFKQKYGLTEGSGFNIFSSISNVYYRENLHSDIIRLILDPSTPKIGNRKNIKRFTDLLKNIHTLEFELDKNITVEREKGRIDVLVHDDKNAIIIENKINNAPVLDDQIGRYYETVKKRNLDVKAIVYLTLTPDKKLDEKIAITDPKKREKIKPLIIPVSAVNENMDISFSEGFVKKCAEYCSKDNELARVYYTQYNELLKSLGGDIMAMEFCKPTIKEIYSDEEKLATFKAFGELWKKKNEVIAEIIKELLKKNNFEEYPNDATIYRKIDDNISLGFYADSGYYSFGYVRTPGGKKKEFSEEKNVLRAFLESNELKKIFVKEPVIFEPGDWVYIFLDIDKIRDFKDIIDNFNILEKLLTKTETQK